MAEDLKPCPVCGDAEPKGDIKKVGTHSVYRIICSNCHYEGIDFLDSKQAETSWNSIFCWKENAALRAELNAWHSQFHPQLSHAVAEREALWAKLKEVAEDYHQAYAHGCQLQAEVERLETYNKGLQTMIDSMNKIHDAIEHTANLDHDYPFDSCSSFAATDYVEWLKARERRYVEALEKIGKDAEQYGAPLATLRSIREDVKEALSTAPGFRASDTSVLASDSQDHIPDAGEKVREKALKEAAEIAEKEIVKHQGFAGDYDRGALHCAFTMKDGILALLAKKDEGRVG